MGDSVNTGSTAREVMRKAPQAIFDYTPCEEVIASLQENTLPQESVGLRTILVRQTPGGSKK